MSDSSPHNTHHVAEAGHAMTSMHLEQCIEMMQANCGLYAAHLQMGL